MSVKGVAWLQAGQVSPWPLRNRGPSQPEGESPVSKPLNPVYSELPTTIFETMSRLAREHQAVNLGQGFPDDPGAEDVRAKAAEAVMTGWNQYPPMMGIRSCARPLQPISPITRGCNSTPTAKSW